jgi:anti-sigma factor (TIGR02949 family)
MDCNTAQTQVFPYVDGELTPELRDEIEAHLAHCGVCRRLVDLEFAFREAYVDRLRPDPVPERVRDQVDTLLRDMHRSRRARRARRRFRRVSLGVAALVLIGVGVGAGVALQSYLGTRTTLADLADAAVEQHQKLVRDLLPPDIKDVSPRAAEEWFRKRLAFNVSLPDLKTERLQFLGGRISHLRDVEVAALEYQVDANNVSLFIIPEEAYRRLRLNDKPRFKVVSHRGYDVVIWRSQGAGYTLVSEIGDRACLVCHAPDEKLEPLPRPSAHL